MFRLMTVWSGRTQPERRLSTPVGPIALDWGFNLARRRALNERSSALHFSIGLF